MIVRSVGLLRLCNIAVLIAGFSGLPATAATFADSVTALSDYRYRGVSLSDRQPVIDASIEISAEPWFAGAEAISASRDRSSTTASRRNAEIDVSAGWSRSLGLLTPTVGAIAYLHPGGGEAANGEVFATLAGALGPATLTAGVNYAPDQSAVRGGNLYLSLRAAAGVPRTPLTLKASVGREAGGFAGGAVKLDYSGGIEARVLRRITFGLAYVGNDRATTGPGRIERNREDGVVVRAGVQF